MNGLAAGRRLLPLVVAFGVFAAATAAALAGSVSWGSAIEVPGTAALNVGGTAAVTSVSCPSAGECVAGGYYGDGSGARAFVASEDGGVWGAAIEVPGVAGLGHSAVSSVSCGSVGNCAAGGIYYDNGVRHAFLASEQNGVWGTAIDVPGTAGLSSSVASVSCASPGNCSAGGSYAYKNGNNAFVVSEKNGTWATAYDLDGKAGLTSRSATVTEVSCGGAGDCAAVGNYSSVFGPFLATERHGKWGQRMKVPGLAFLSAGGIEQVTSVSCASPGNCTAVGRYSHGTRRPPRSYYAFAVEEKNGTWGKAKTVTGIGNAGFVASVSCVSAGNCAVGMSSGGHANKFDDTGYFQALVASERNGKWGTSVELPGTAAFGGASGVARVSSVSCARAGDCAAVGFYLDASSYQWRAFVVAEQGGVWGTAEDVPGTADLGNYVAWPGFPTVSCASTGNCAIGGSDVDGTGHTQAFVTAP